MRVTDLSIQQTYLTNYQKNKRTLQNIQQQITTQSKVNTPSDNPLANSKILRFGNQLGNFNTYKNNINTSIGFVQNTLLPMEGMQNEMNKVIIDLTSMNNAVVDDKLDIYAQNLDLTLATLLDFANAEYDGRYVFGGNDSSSKPFDYNAAGDKVEAKLPNIGGEHLARISKNSSQKINITGQEMFQSVYEQRGNLDSTSAIGSVDTSNETILDADGNEYTLTYNYTKTAANTYDFSYDITDSTAASVGSGTVNDLVFNPASSKLTSINGGNPEEIEINIPGNKIEFQFDLTNIKENTNPTNLNLNKNQDADIFNILISMKNKLNNGERPNDNQVKMVNNFMNHLTNKMSEVGNISNKLLDAAELIDSQRLAVQEYMSIEKDVDMAEAIIELETSQHSLDINYKISSMILPSSLLDYL
ncbi:MAG: flagellar hook-associated protein FlgL [Melioribacteraceae bacterium]|nr:flagellar hook-associated protein FlgL [Melioribacteraceae bacterium]